ncbi:reverse transcriptase domain-containing protein [Streptomyces mirabilis]|uniref:reverse transcriptase domain-containing protein n=1 Tax=Streptomyces mirabilis TaxID=68239 RepID=UPI0036917D70
MTREFPTVWFERYADDAVLHCVTERQAREVLAALMDRMAEVGLRLHPDKTRMVYCKNGSRRGSFEHEAFTFLGYTFRATRNRTRHGRLFMSFEPAVSKDALKRIGRDVRSWQLHTRSDVSFNELARWVLHRKYRVERLDEFLGGNGHEARGCITVQQRAHVLDGLRRREHG